MNFFNSLDSFIEIFESSAKQYFARRRAEAKDVASLMDSIEYSFFNGGKRFRPRLCYAMAEAVALSPAEVTPFAMAVEAIHTYSLIHDDLPCMDGDVERRGQPSNHMKFSEDMALLAGDGLLTEAFLMVAQAYPQNTAELVRMLAEGAGLNGMIRGQVLDLGQGSPINQLNDLVHLHELKTGRLIALCFMGPACLKGRKDPFFRELGLMLGLAFQIKDDLLDAEEKSRASFIYFLGIEKAEDYLSSLTKRIQSSLDDLEINSAALQDLVEFNFSRAK